MISCRFNIFKYFSFLATHPQFMGEILAAWQKETAVGSELFLLGQRLKEIKKVCRRLNKIGFGNIQQKTRLVMEELQEIQSELLVSPTETLFRREFVARKRWKFLDSALQIFFRTKSRIRWLKEGDANTKFFYKAVITHQARNVIRFLFDIHGAKITNKAQIKDMVVSYFQHLLGSVSSFVTPASVAEFKCIMTYRCPASLVENLCGLHSDEEISLTLMSMPKSKAPGPEGFPAEFFWDAWTVVGKDVTAAIKEFFVGGRMLRKFNATAISLIPKVVGADRLNMFRPISLFSTVYKVIARVLKNKIKLFIDDVVQRNQVGFIQGRLLCENVLLASELVTDFNVEGRVSRGCLKIDLAKAYDNISWEFIMNLLEAIERPDKLIGWIKECITTASFSVVVNGELHGFFQGKRGLRQGDPISSLLFVLAMDVLSKMLDAGAVNNRFRPHPSCEEPLITHLSFAYDVLVFFDGSEDSLQGILEILEEFKQISRLSINRDKTELMIDGGSHSVCQELAESLEIKQGELSVRYLVVPLASKKMRKSDFKPLLDKVEARFNSWTVKHLSFAGRFQLIQAVIYSTISFWTSIFILPKECITILERMCNAFPWDGPPQSARGAKISWDIICTTKKEGGLGLRKLADWNQVLALKLIWLLFVAGGSLWVSWIRRNKIGSDNF